MPRLKLPTGGLYWRLVLWFWLILVAMLLLLLVLPRAWSPPPPAMPFDGQPPPPVARALQRLADGRPLPPRHGRDEQLLVFSHDGEQLKGPAASPRLLAELPQWLDQPPQLRVIDGWHYLGPFAVDGDGPVLLARRKAPHAGALVARFISDWPLLAFGLFFAVSAAGCALLASRLGRPLRQLEHHARELASGQWQSRPDRQLQQRHDEFGQLARTMSTMADALERELLARQTLLHYVSHELKSPLTRLRLAAGLLRRQQGEEMLQQVERAVAQLDERLNQVLMLTRSQTPLGGQQRLLLTPLVEAAVADLALTIEQRGLTCTTELCAVSVNGDGVMLRALLDNLLDNACRHARQRVAIRMTRNGDEVQLMVADDGRGLMLEDGQDPFAPFVQGQGHSGQAGLGLAIVAAVSRQHGGRVSAERGELGGLQVNLVLPVATGDGGR